MGSPEDREKKRRRIKQHVKKDLNKKKFKPKMPVQEGSDKKVVNVKKLSHAELIKLINEKEDDEQS